MKPMTRTTRSGLLRAFAGAMLAASALAFSGVHAAPPSGLLQITGAVKTNLELTPEDLKALPADQISSVTMTRRVDGKEISSTVRGVKLSTLLERAAPLAPDRHAWKHMVVLACGIDGYCVTFSWPELTNTEVGAGVLVIFERDGEPLGDGEGQLALVSARDLNGGPRHVKWLGRVELRLL